MKVYNHINVLPISTKHQFSIVMSVRHTEPAVCTPQKYVFSQGGTICLEKRRDKKKRSITQKLFPVCVCVFYVCGT